VKPRCGAALVLSIAALANAAALVSPLAAATKLEGEYQLMMDMRKSQRFFPWDWDSNNNDSYTGAQFRLFSAPRAGVEAFMRIEADWKDSENNTERPLFQFREAHARFRWDRITRGVDSHLFSRQERFWVDNYLIKVVETDPLKNDRWGSNAQGVRIDTWGYLGLNTSFVATDFSDQFNPVLGTGDPGRGSPLRTDDAYIARVRREFFKDRALRLGATWNRKEENQNNERPEHAEVFAFDSRYRFRNVDYSLEYAQSQSPLLASSVYFPHELDRKITVFGSSTPVRFPDRGVLLAEIRSLRIGAPMIGYLNFVPTYWRRGALYENRAGDGNRDETGYNMNFWYLLPERAITITTNFKQLHKYAFENRSFQEFYNEAYIEFVNGFTGKTFYRKQRTIRTLGRDVDIEIHNDAFFEVQVESQLAWLRVQSKLKDIGQVTHKQLYSIENSINLTSKVKVYNRFAFGNDPNFLRKGIFSQLQYRPTGSMEMFIEYGPSWIGDSSTPVDDGDLEGGGDQTDIMKFILKGSF